MRCLSLGSLTSVIGANTRPIDLLPGRQPAQTIKSRIFVGVTVGRRVHRHVRDGIHSTATANDHLTDPDNFRCDITHTMHANQPSVIFQEDQLEKSSAAGDGASWSEIEVGTANLIIETFFPTLLL